MTLTIDSIKIDILCRECEAIFEKDVQFCIGRGSQLRLTYVLRKGTNRIGNSDLSNCCSSCGSTIVIEQENISMLKVQAIIAKAESRTKDLNFNRRWAFRTVTSVNKQLSFIKDAVVVRMPQPQCRRNRYQQFEASANQVETVQMTQTNPNIEENFFLGLSAFLKQWTEGQATQRNDEEAERKKEQLQREEEEKKAAQEAEKIRQKLFNKIEDAFTLFDEYDPSGEKSEKILKDIDKLILPSINNVRQYCQPSTDLETVFLRTKELSELGSLLTRKDAKALLYKTIMIHITNSIRMHDSEKRKMARKTTSQSDNRKTGQLFGK